jgi:hypothetical protein
LDDGSAPELRFLTFFLQVQNAVKTSKETGLQRSLPENFDHQSQRDCFAVAQRVNSVDTYGVHPMESGAAGS